MRRFRALAIISVSIPVLLAVGSCGRSDPKPRGAGGSGSSSADGSDSASEEGESDPSNGSEGSSPGATTSESIGVSEGGGSSTSDPSGDSTGAPSGCVYDDMPDSAGIDGNGDGVDGTVCASIFVGGVAASDDNDGMTPFTSVATLPVALAMAAEYDPPRDVLVASGVYVTQLRMYDGVDMHGGYSSTFTEHDSAAHVSTIAGESEKAITVGALTESTSVIGFTIRGASFESGGAHTYAVWAKDVPADTMVFSDCVIEAGQAGAGSLGGHGVDGLAGSEGASGEDGGAGAVAQCFGVGGAGGRGETCPSSSGSTATGPAGVLVGAGGASGGSDCAGSCGDRGGPGQDGSDGGPGINGQSAPAVLTPLGLISSDGSYIAAVSEFPIPATAGGSGGGGGAGGYDLDSLGCGDGGDARGGVGGGGGAGGCGGLGGQPGQPGGSSFAALLVNSQVEFRSTSIRVGSGGAGGDGGTGGDGAVGAAGGVGSVPILMAGGDGGRGGAGGPGGGGAGGAGGCGGNAIGIALRNSTASTNDVVIQGGSAGAGGAAGLGGTHGDGGEEADAGAAGCAGELHQVYDFGFEWGEAPR